MAVSFAPSVCTDNSMPTYTPHYITTLVNGTEEYRQMANVVPSSKQHFLLDDIVQKGSALVKGQLERV